jgi:hypothetical protein
MLLAWKDGVKAATTSDGRRSILDDAIIINVQTSNGSTDEVFLEMPIITFFAAGCETGQ